jgi:potassium efflux system protein
LRRLGQILLLVMLISALGAASAQEVPVANELNQELVSARIQTLRDAGSQAGEETALGTYEAVLNWLGEAEVHAASEKSYVQSLNDAPLQESEIRDRMESTDYRAPDYDPTTVSRLKKQKLDEQLSALRVKLRDASTAKTSLDEQIASEQSSAPNIQARFEVIDKRIQELPSTAVTIEPDLQPSQFEATQWSVLAERKALIAERRSLEARLASQAVRYSRRKAESDEFVLILDGLAYEIGILETELASREKVLESESSISLDQDSPGYGFVQQLVEGNEQLRAESTELNTTLIALKEENDRVESQFLSLNDRFEAVQQIVSLSENSPSLGHVLMVHWHQTDSFRLPATESRIASAIGEHVIQRTQYEDSLATLSNTTAYLLNGFSVEIGSPEPEVDEDMLEAAKGRIRTKRELLTELIAIETELINVHGNIDRTRQQLGVQFAEYQRYLSSRILWVQSHPPISLASLKNIKQEFRDLAVKFSELRFGPLTPMTGLLLALILFSLVLRGKMDSFLQNINNKVGRVREDSIRFTFWTLLITIVRSIATPLLLVVLASGLVSTSTGPAPYLSKSLFESAQILFVILMLRTACKENGIARVHFDWAPVTCREIRRFTTWLLIWWWPLMLITAILFKLEVDSINAVFGRLLFVVTMVVLGITLSRFLSSEFREIARTRRRRFGEAFLVIFITVFSIAGTLLGYLYTVNIAWETLLDSLLIGFGLLFFYYFMQRWLLVVRRRLRFSELLTARQAHQESEAPEAEAEPELVDLVKLSASVSQLLKAGTLTLGVIWLAYIWAPMFRALEAMQRITLWTVSDLSDGEAILTSITLATLALALFIGFITFFAARYVPQLLALVLRSRQSITPGSRYAIVKLLGYLIISVGVLAFLSTLGVRWDRLQWLVAALGVGIGFGLQEIIANFISGLLILFEKPIRVGDVITVGDSSGQVIRIEIRATTIRDFDGKELLVPNKEFVTGRLLNWTLSNTDIRMSLEVGIAYGSDVRKAVAILEDILVNHEMILDRPEPDVLFREFGNNSLNLLARYFFSDIEQRGYLLSDLHLKINDAFAEAGIVIAFPQIDVHFDPGSSNRAMNEAPIPGST